MRQTMSCPAWHSFSVQPELRRNVFGNIRIASCCLTVDVQHWVLSASPSIVSNALSDVTAHFRRN